MIARIRNFYCQTEASFRQTQVIEHFTVNLARNVSIMLDNIGIHSQTIFSTLLAMDNVHYRLIFDPQKSRREKRNSRKEILKSSKCQNLVAKSCKIGKIYPWEVPKFLY